MFRLRRCATVFYKPHSAFVAIETLVWGWFKSSCWWYQSHVTFRCWMHTGSPAGITTNFSLFHYRIFKAKSQINKKETQPTKNKEESAESNRSLKLYSCTVNFDQPPVSTYLQGVVDVATIQCLWPALSSSEWASLAVHGMCAINRTPEALHILKTLKTASRVSEGN